jgi:hypothetical protein
MAIEVNPLLGVDLKIEAYGTVTNPEPEPDDEPGDDEGEDD